MRTVRVVFCALIAVAVYACSSKPQTYSGPYGKQVGEAIPRIEAAVGLKFKRPPKVETRTKEQVRAFLLNEFTDSTQIREMAGQELAYKRLGMLPDTLHLKDLLVNLLEEQIVGFYDPKTKVLYIVNGSPADVVGITVTHELVHALMIVVAIGALALAFMVGVILLSTLAIAGTLIGAGLVIRNKLRRGLRPSLERHDVRASLDPAMEVRPDRELLPPGESPDDVA